MSKTKGSFSSFYLDEDVSMIAARIIRAHGFDVICASEAKRTGKSDKEQLEYAIQQNRILVTHNIRDFILLHKDYIDKGLRHNGIILAVRRRDNYDFARRLLGLLQYLKPGGLDSQIRYIYLTLENPRFPQ